MNHHGERKDALNVNTKIGNWDGKNTLCIYFSTWED